MATCSNCQKHRATYRVKSSVLCLKCFMNTNLDYRTDAERLNPRRHRKGNRRQDFQPNVQLLKRAAR